MPRSYANPDTSGTWETLLLAVVNHLRANRTLSQTVADIEPPAVEINTVAFVGDGQSDTVECHYARINLTVLDWGTYTTS